MKKSKFLDQVKDVIGTNHLGHTTEKIHVGRLYWFIIFHGKRPPREIGGKKGWGIP